MASFIFGVVFIYNFQYFHLYAGKNMFIIGTDYCVKSQTKLTRENANERISNQLWKLFP